MRLRTHYDIRIFSCYERMEGSLFFKALYALNIDVDTFEFLLRSLLIIRDGSQLILILVMAVIRKPYKQVF